MPPRSGHALLRLAASASLLLACTTTPSGSEATSAASGSTSVAATDATAATEASTHATGAAATGTSDASAATEATAATGTTGEPLIPGDDAQIPIFDAEHIYFGGENHRQADVAVTLPSGGEFDQITLNLALGCPNSLCDHWDRYGTIGVVRWPGAEDEGYVEIARFITAYRLPASWALDLTELAPLLRGDVTFRVFIDTWVGPGSDQGEGWLVNASLDYHGGIASPRPLEVIPLWYTSFGSGDPQKPLEDQLSEATFAAVAGADRYHLRTHITGHGFGNTLNCAEFCPREHAYLLNDKDASVKTIWRDDCQETAVQDQYGTWKYPRAGWCPGADVIPWTIDISDQVQAGDNKVRYLTDEYENSCRPDLGVCAGCTAGATCDDGHGQPYYYMSALLIALAD